MTAITPRERTAQKQAIESARSMIESSLDSLVSISPEGKILDVNEALIKVTGVARHQLIGTDFSDYFTEPAKAEAIYQLVFAEGMAVDYPLTIRRPDGTLTDVRYNASVYRDVEGNVLGVFAAARDVTAQKQAQAETIEERSKVEEANVDLHAVEGEVLVLNRGLEDRVRELAASEARFRSLVEGAPDAMLIVGETGELQLVNAQAEKLFGYDKEELLGCSVEILVPESFRSVHSQHRLGYLSAPTAREMAPDLELYGRRKDGTEFPVEISLSPLPTADGMTVSAAIRDVTARRQLSHELESVNQELDAFAYSVAHDLRTPLRSIDGFSQVLLEDYASVLDAEGTAHLQRVRKAAQRMGTLIDDLLSLSRVARADVTIDRIDLTEMVTTIVEELRSAEPDRRAEVEIDDGLVTQADPRLADVVLRNLVGNAWKFTSATEYAGIHFGAASEPGWFSVADNGAGFDTDHAARMFSPFQRFHSAAAFPGSGVGLAIVKRILNRHGGDIHAEAAPGEGATFTFTFGAQASHRPPSTMRPGSGDSHSGGHHE